jgi:putative SOS response-associated peptidase YedK
MCGRFANRGKREDYEKEFFVGKLNKVSFNPRYNIAPAEMIYAVLESDTERVLTELKWGLIPSWAKDNSIGDKLINARSETLSEKPSFKDSFKKRRCIIPASGFYEWKKSAGGKQPYYFYLKDRDVFGFAGLWEEWTDKQTGEVIETCTIITTEANKVLEPVHNRMPVILKPEAYDLWLDEKEKNTDRLQKLLVPYLAPEMASHAVGKAVNIPGSDSPELIRELNSK